MGRAGGEQRSRITVAVVDSGVTTVNQGTLSITSLADGGLASSIGQSSNAAGNLVLNPKALKAFFAFQRLAFGAVRIRTDGERLLVYTDSAKATVKEAYAYEIDAAHKVKPVAVVQF